MPKVLSRLKISRVAHVDRGAGEGVKVMLIKRDEGHDPNDVETDAYLKREFSEEQRQRAAESGSALADGSYPVENEQDLRNALKAYGRGNDKPAVKAHIMRRARSLGRSDLIPDKWKESKAKAVSAITKFLGWAGIAKDAVDFDEAQANQEANEYAQGVLCEVDEATCSLREAICSIMSDPTVTDKQAAVEESLEQFRQHLQGVMPEGLENAMAAAGLIAAGYTATPGGALTKGDGTVAEKTKDELDKEAAEKAKTEKTAKRLEAVFKMSGAHAAFMNNDDATMPEGGKEAFTDMSADERDAHMKKHPIADAKKKRDEELVAALPPEMQATLKRAAEDSVTLASLQKSAEITSFAKRCGEIGLAETHAETLYKAHHGDGAAVTALEDLLKAANAQADAGTVFSEFGTRQQQKSEIGGEIDAIVKTMQAADPKLTKDAAVLKIAESREPAHRELWKRYKAESAQQKAA